MTARSPTSADRTDFSFRSSAVQGRKNRFVYLVLAERCLILSKAQAPQPDRNVHGGAYNRGCVHHPPGKRECPGWRWGSQGLTKYVEGLTAIAGL